LVFRGDLQGPWHLDMLEWHDQKIIIFAFRAVFMSYCPQFWGSGMIYKDYDT
jgi:hypothetical protein